MNRPVIAACLLASLALGCGPDRPAESPAPPSSAGPSRPAFDRAPPPNEEDRELLEAQIKLSRSIGLGLLVGATVIYSATSACPTPDDVINAGQISNKLSSRDIWGTPYRILCPPDGHLEVVSAGPDLAFDTEDDLHIRAE